MIFGRCIKEAFNHLITYDNKYITKINQRVLLFQTKKQLCDKKYINDFKTETS